MAQIQIYGTLSQTDSKQDEYIQNAYDACEEKGATMPEEKTLENLADCIETIQGGAVVPPEAGDLVNLVVGTLPKTSYVEGEPLDLSNAVILGNYSNGGQYDVTASCTFIANDPVLFYDTKITASLDDKTLDIPITVTGAPVKAPDSTLLLLHMDGNLKDEVSGNYGSGDITTHTGHFDKALNGKNNEGTTFANFTLTANQIKNGQYTIEYWGMYDYASNGVPRVARQLQLIGNDVISDGITWAYASDETKVYKPTTWVQKSWHHYALVLDSGLYRIYVDGKLWTRGTIQSNVYDFTAIKSYNASCIIDEFMICNEVKYVTDFEPSHGPYYLEEE